MGWLIFHIRLEISQNFTSRKKKKKSPNIPWEDLEMPVAQEGREGHEYGTKQRLVRT